MEAIDLYILSLWAVLLLDLSLGDPDWLWRRIPHPVIGFGKLISLCDTALNDPKYSAALRKQYGFATILILGAFALLMGYALSQAGIIIEIIAAFILMASKSLIDHVKAIILPLQSGNIIKARQMLARIVGRNTASMDQAQIVAASVESTAENFSDGVIAPFFWYMLGGLPTLILYKMVNTADSMIGYKNEKYSDFGFGAAKLDDALNYIPARITAFLIIIATGLYHHQYRRAYKIMKIDGRKHASPNGGVVEAAMAGALNIRLGGPRQYGNVDYDAPYIHADGDASPTPLVIEKALLHIYIILLMLIIGLSCLLLIRLFFWLPS